MAKSSLLLKKGNIWHNYRSLKYFTNHHVDIVSMAKNKIKSTNSLGEKHFERHFIIKTILESQFSMGLIFLHVLQAEALSTFVLGYHFKGINNHER